MRSTLTFLLVAGWVALLGAQEPEVTLDVSPREIGINETLKFQITISNGPRGRAPSFPNGFDGGDFRLIQSQPSTSSQTSIRNGVVSSVTSYTYYLRANKQGTFTFPAQTVQVGSERYTSKPVQITVGDQVTSVPRGQRRSPWSSFSDPPQRQQRQQYEIFAEMETPRNTYYLGEAIPLAIKVYRTQGLNINGNGSSMDLPDFTDFWVEDVDRETWQDTAIRDNKRYQVDTLAERVLYANKAGTFKIPETRFNLNVQVGNSFFANRQMVERFTNALELEIKPLPDQGKPAGFTNLVGTFKLKGELDKNELKQGESLSLKLIVEGNGNFTAVRDFDLEYLKRDFEIYPGGTPDTEKKGGMVARKSWVYALVPKNAGEQSIALPQLSFFDPDKKEYRMTPEKALSINVLPGEVLDGGRLTAGRERGEIIAEQNLSYIKLGDLGEIGTTVRLTSPMVLAQLAGAVLFADLLLFLGLSLRHRGLAFRHANRGRFAYKQFLKQVSGLSNKEGEAFYAGLHDAMMSFFGDKWDRPGQGLSLEIIRTTFEKKGYPTEGCEAVAACIESIEMARYTGSSAASRDQLLDKAKAAIKTCDEVMA
ncbi:BatD family protein [Acanthopleuribacter pedis]|uniref:Protein BatD n=1 Tax=Acanthopleuribacter pedis TaxID=442870 RepID=A0A8J7QER5_9BACT|nr:BatD family protein [Acanthopleuribacter pedis]MBO1323307.1 protein BatD [Acanthopleuribacter pedis]